MAESPEPFRKGPESENGTVITEPVSKAGSKRSYASTHISKASWVTFGSPLWHKDRVPSSVRSLPPILSQRDLEENFVNDGIVTTTTARDKRKPIIPPYNAVGDRYARHYFKSPSVKAMMERSKAHKIYPPFPRCIAQYTSCLNCGSPRRSVAEPRITIQTGGILSDAPREGLLWNDKHDAFQGEKKFPLKRKRFIGESFVLREETCWSQLSANTKKWSAKTTSSDCNDYLKR